MRTRWIAIGSLLAMISANGMAASSKYGIVNMQKVILSVAEGKAARAGLESEIKAKEAELQKKKQELDKMNEDWKSQSPLMSEEAKMTKQKEFQEKFVALRDEEAKFQQDIKMKEGQATQKIAITVQGMVDEMARSKKLEAVFETNSAGLLYLENPTDLTDIVIAEYDKRPAGGSKSAVKAPDAKTSKK